MSFLMKSMCFYYDRVGFWTDFGGFQWILHGFWSLGPLWRPENTENLEKNRKKIEKSWEKNFHQKTPKNMRFVGKFWNF